MSPLTNSTTGFANIPGSILEITGELEKFLDLEVENPVVNNGQVQTEITIDQQLFAPSNANAANIRRHTVGPGDVTHKQVALVNPPTLTFKYGGDTGPNIPMNLPMLQNQPLNNFTIKDQHLLKPPMAMGASMYSR